MTTEITKEVFEKYKKVQESGETNMFDVKTVMVLSGISREEIITIMETYSTLAEKYGGPAF